MLYGNKTMRMNGKQLLQQVPKQHYIEGMDLVRFSKVRRAVSQYLQTEVLKQYFQEFPFFLDFLIQLNKHFASVALQTEQGNNTFLRFLWVFQFLRNWES